jgi:hypothetical protein
MYLRNDSTIAHTNTMNKIQEQKKRQKGSAIGSRAEGHAPCFGGDTLINSLHRRCVQSVPCLVRADNLPPPHSGPKQVKCPRAIDCSFNA